MLHSSQKQPLLKRLLESETSLVISTMSVPISAGYPRQEKITVSGNHSQVKENQYKTDEENIYLQNIMAIGNSLNAHQHEDNIN